MDAVHQRGQTAVLGAQPRFIDVLPSTAIASGSKPPAPRAIARRKQQRKDNARLASNPHVVRPSPRDYAVKHNDHAPSFPIPADLQHIFSAATGAPSPTRLPTSDQGGLRMSYSDAHWFLANRVGFHPKEPPTDDMSTLQRFAKTVEREITAWLSQDIFLRPDGAGDRVLFDDDSTTLLEVARNPHHLVWEIADPFKRLTVHCLARIHGCATLSKDSRAAVRQTWILKSRAQQRLHRHPTLALDTPPTTDIGTDIASAINTDSDWTGAAMSDVDEGTLSDSDCDQPYARDNNATAAATPHRIRTLPEDDEDDHFADVES